jgi:hypothetical protein
LFFDVADDIGVVPIDTSYPSRGVATADSFGDGKLDFAIASQWGDTIFYRNKSPSHNRFIGLHVRLPIEPTNHFEIIPGHPNAAIPSRPAIGATATVVLPDGRRRIDQVDGGNGHSGKRSPDIHFGLSDLAGEQMTEIELRWRDQNGEPRRRTIQVSPGWHTVILAGPEGRS